MIFPYYPPQEPKEPLDEKLMLFFSMPDFTGGSLAFWKFVKEKGYKTAWIVKKREIFEKMRDMGMECALLEDMAKVRHYFSIAKYFLYNRDIPYGYPKLKGQIYVHLTQYSAPFGDGYNIPKLFGDVQPLAKYLMYDKWRSAMFDIGTVTSELLRNLYASGYYANTLNVFVTGAPQHDSLFLSAGKDILSDNMPQINNYTSLVGYFPSGTTDFFKGKGFADNIFNISGLDIQALEDFLEENKVAIIIKLHPVDENYFNIKNVVVDIPKHCYLINSNSFFNYSLYDIVNAFSALITDVSTVGNDFLLLDRPLIYMMEQADLAFRKHQDKYQSFYCFDKNMHFPGHKVYTPDDFFSALTESITNPGKHKAERKMTRDLMFKYQDANSCERILDVIENYKPLENINAYEMYTTPLVESYDAQIAERDQQVAERDQTIANLNSRYNTQIDNLSTQIMILNNRYGTQIDSLGMQTGNIDAYIHSIDMFIDRLDTQIDGLSAQIDGLNESYSAQVANLNAIIRNREHELSERVNELNAIKNSRAYKLALIPSKIFYPEGSRRRILYILMKKTIRHPILMLKNANPRNIKAFIRKLRKHELARVEELVNYSVQPVNDYVAKLILDYDDYKGNYPKLTLPVFDEPLVSIVIPVYNQWDYTYKCIASVLKHTEIPYEVIIADDNSNDETRRLEKTIENAVHIQNKKNLRFLLNCNNAAKYAKGKYLFFLNNDTQVQPDWLRALVEIMEHDESIGLAGSKLVYPDGRLQEAGGILWKDGSAWNYGRLDHPEKPDYNYVKEVDYISGAAILVRKSLWDKLGGFDESFAPAYFEDADFAFTIRQAGYKTVYQPKSVVVHFEGISNGTDMTGGQKQYQVINAEKFYDKWKHILETGHFTNGEDVFLARDRSRGKETILFIDHYVPMFDKDAGSRNTFSYVKLCADMGYHVIFLGDNFFPHQPYTDILEQMGIQVLYGPWYQNNWKKWLEQNGKYLDYVYLNRPHISEVYIDVIRKNTNARIIYHGVDLHFMRIMAQYEITKDADLLKKAKTWEAKEKALFSKSDVILTVSEKEQIVISKISEAEDKKVLVLPILFFDDFPEIKDFSTRKDILFVGGFNHPPNADAVQWFASEIMPLLPEIKLIVVGSNPPDSINALASSNIEIKGFVSDEELNHLYATSKIAVMPLRFGAGVKGKTIEAMHNLIPCVSTSFGIEGLPELDKLIPPHDNAQEFADEIKRFLESDDLCRQTVEEYREWLMKWFSTERARQLVREMTSN